MKRGMLLAVYLLLTIIITACGSSEQACAEQCAMAFSKNNTKCNATHGRLSSEGAACTKLALKENDQCAASCYGI